MRGQYGGYTPTKDYEPVGGDRHSDMNGSSRLNGNSRPDMYEIPTGKWTVSQLRVTLSGCRLQILRFLFSGASTDNLPPGVLYKVKATYKYQAEDMDELAFEVGELIQVIEYDDPEEQVCVVFSDESHVTSLRVSGGGLAHGNEGVHRTEGIVPS